VRQRRDLVVQRAREFPELLVGGSVFRRDGAREPGDVGFLVHAHRRFGHREQTGEVHLVREFLAERLLRLHLAVQNLQRPLALRDGALNRASRLLGDARALAVRVPRLARLRAQPLGELGGVFGDALHGGDALRLGGLARARVFPVRLAPLGARHAQRLAQPQVLGVRLVVPGAQRLRHRVRHRPALDRLAGLVRLPEALELAPREEQLLPDHGQLARVRVVGLQARLRFSPQLGVDTQPRDVCLELLARPVRRRERAQLGRLGAAELLGEVRLARPRRLQRVGVAGDAALQRPEHARGDDRAVVGVRRVGVLWERTQRVAHDGLVEGVAQHRLHAGAVFAFALDGDAELVDGGLERPRVRLGDVRAPRGFRGGDLPPRHLFRLVPRGDEPPLRAFAQVRHRVGVAAVAQVAQTLRRQKILILVASRGVAASRGRRRGGEDSAGRQT
jgi:hypothetical protein